MNTPPDDNLLLAFDVAVGRAAPGGADPDLLAFARTVVTELRAVLDAPACPTAFVRRAQALYAKRPKAWLQRVLELVFDSWAEPAVAHRGAIARRALRYEASDVEVDVEVGRSSQGRPVLLLAIASEAEDLRVGIEVGAGRERAVRLDEGGAGRVELPAGASQAIVVLRAGDEEIARTPPIPLE
jgi:hypothetical protein